MIFWPSNGKAFLRASNSIQVMARDLQFWIFSIPLAEFSSNHHIQHASRGAGKEITKLQECTRDCPCPHLRGRLMRRPWQMPQVTARGTYPVDENFRKKERNGLEIRVVLRGIQGRLVHSGLPVGLQSPGMCTAWDGSKIYGVLRCDLFLKRAEGVEKGWEVQASGSRVHMLLSEKVS